LRRWIWVSIRRGRASGADAPSGRGGRCSPILRRLHEGGNSWTASPYHARAVTFKRCNFMGLLDNAH
jgi:hypothetical protein